MNDTNICEFCKKCLTILNMELSDTYICNECIKMKLNKTLRDEFEKEKIILEKYQTELIEKNIYKEKEISKLNILLDSKEVYIINLEEKIEYYKNLMMSIIKEKIHTNKLL